MQEIYRKFKTFRINVPAKDEVVTLDAETDRLYDMVDGIKALCSVENAKYGSTIKMAINEEEIFSDNFDLINITSSEDCPVDERFYTDKGKLNIPAKGSTVKIVYADGGNAGDNYPYTVSIIIAQKRN